MSEKISFKRSVKSRLAELDMSQAELAKQLGINRKYLNLIIAGERKGIQKREAIIEILNLPSFLKDVI